MTRRSTADHTKAAGCQVPGLRGALLAGFGQQLRDRGADLALACAEPGQYLGSGVVVAAEQCEQEVPVPM